MSNEASKGGRLFEAAYLPRGVGFLMAIDSLKRLVIVSLIACRSSPISDFAMIFGENGTSSTEDIEESSSSSLLEISESSMSEESILFGTSPEAIDVADYH